MAPLCTLPVECAAAEQWLTVLRSDCSGGAGAFEDGVEDAAGREAIADGVELGDLALEGGGERGAGLAAAGEDDGVYVFDGPLLAGEGVADADGAAFHGDEAGEGVHDDALLQEAFQQDMVEAGVLVFGDEHALGDEGDVAAAVGEELGEAGGGVVAVVTSDEADAGAGDLFSLEDLPGGDDVGRRDARHVWDEGGGAGGDDNCVRGEGRG